MSNALDEYSSIRKAVLLILADAGGAHRETTEAAELDTAAKGLEGFTPEQLREVDTELSKLSEEDLEVVAIDEQLKAEELISPLVNEVLDAVFGAMSGD